MVPGFSDPIWKMLLTPPLLTSCGSRVPPAVASRPCLAPPPPIKQDAVSSEAVRKAIYSAALDFMSSGVRHQCSQPRLVLPQRHQHLLHHRHQQTIQQQRVLTYSELTHQHQQSTGHDNTHYQRHTVPVTSFITSPGSELQSGMFWRLHACSV